jgi:hypothetical protein
MRRLACRVSLGIMLACSSVLAVDDPLGGREKRPAETSAVAPPVASVDGSRGWTRWIMPALQRLRLSPGHDHGDRAAASRLRP